jgi:hypothetical protein
MSAWDEWDSDEEGDKASLVKYWRGKKWRGSRGSLGGSGSGGARRDSAGKDGEESAGTGKDKEEGRRKRRGFVRVIRCGCGEKV